MEATLESHEVKLVLDARAQLGECPLWSAAEQKLYWVDISGCSVNRFDPATGNNQSWLMPCEPGCIGVAASGGLVAALRDGFYRFYPDADRLEKIADAPYDTANMRFNDGRCDAVGRFWAGAMYEPRTAEAAAMFCLERGKTRTGWGPEHGLGVKVSNGLAFSADGTLAYQSDTPNHVIYRFAFHEETGNIGARTEFARRLADTYSANYGGRPDGAAIDIEGNYWSAQYEGGCILRYSPQGDITRSIRLPVKRPTMVAFGGQTMSTLYITTAREGASPAELAANDRAGGLFACEVDVPGRAEPFYID
jgi:sugar lactone lactonase YvrE